MYLRIFFTLSVHTSSNFIQSPFVFDYFWKVIISAMLQIFMDPLKFLMKFEFLDIKWSVSFISLFVQIFSKKGTTWCPGRFSASIFLLNIKNALFLDVYMRNCHSCDKSHATCLFFYPTKKKPILLILFNNWLIISIL